MYLVCHFRGILKPISKEIITRIVFYEKNQQISPFFKNKKHKIALYYKGNSLKNIHARVMALVHDMSSECALQMYEVSSLKYLLRLSSYRADTK